MTSPEDGSQNAFLSLVPPHGTRNGTNRTSYPDNERGNVTTRRSDIPTSSTLHWRGRHSEMEFVAPRPGPVREWHWWSHVQDYATSVIESVVENVADISDSKGRVFKATAGITIMLFLFLVVTSQPNIFTQPICSSSTLSIPFCRWGTDEGPKAHTSFGWVLDEDDTRETPIADPGETFNWPDGDVILHTVHGAETRDFRVHKPFLSFASPVFKDMLTPPESFLPFLSPIFKFVFATPKSSSSASGIHTINLDDPPRALELILRLIYPSSSPPATDDLTIVSEALDIANKYDIQVARIKLRSSLMGFMKTEPLRVYAIASRLGYEDEMKIASTHTLSIHFPTLIQLPDEFKLIPVTEYHRLIDLHTRYRKEVAAIAVNSLSGLFVELDHLVETFELEKCRPPVGKNLACPTIHSLLISKQFQRVPRQVLRPSGIGTS